MKKIISILIIILFITSCKKYEVSNNTYDSSKNIVILYSNIFPANENIDDIYKKIENVRDELLKETPNVTLVDTGNNLYIDKMNEVGYDYACFGLNNFSEGLDSVYEYTNEAKYKYLLCSASYSGQVKDVFKKTTPYEIVDYDGIKIAYVGVLSPRYLETKPEFFMEDGEAVVNFYNETEEVFYDTVQCSIDKAKSKNADYIVLLSNFDDNPTYSPYTIEELVSNLSDINIVINGNEYSTGSKIKLYDINNKPVDVVSNGLNSDHYSAIIISNGNIEIRNYN